MALDFQQVRQQITQLGEAAPQRKKLLQDKREQAESLLVGYAEEIDLLRQKVLRVSRDYDLTLRCALPVAEPLNTHISQGPTPAQASVLAADGSQINLDRHEQVEYCLVNVGGIELKYGSQEPPVTTVNTHLFYDEQLYTTTGKITEATLALMRDVYERDMLAELAQDASPPVITLTDGPMELWGVKGGSESATSFQQYLEKYLESLKKLSELGVATAGYVDKPGANLVTRTLEVAGIAEADLAEVKKTHPFRGVSDIDLYKDILASGERSAVFAIQSHSARNYKDGLALHFFYLNVGKPANPWLARVEIPAWVLGHPEMLDNLHAVLVDQCRVLGGRAFPYVLHRAHETAVVSQQEKGQVTQMIISELRKRGLSPLGQSAKQATKELAGRRRYQL
jgi:hypothetical protein